MNILVMESNPGELGLIQQAVGKATNTIMQAVSSEQAWMAFQGGDIRMMIINEDTTDADVTGLIQRIRAAQANEPVYILLITSKIVGDVPVSGADDVLRRPYSPAELKNRILMAERILLLTSNLLTARVQLESQAAYDPLTGIFNHAGFLRQTAGELERSRRASLPLCLIALDIDNFKVINDKFGTKIGDEVLQVISKTIREKSRPYDCIGRWAGDEFVLALPGVIGADGEKVAERIIAGARGTRVEVPNEPPLNIKVSAGVASVMRVTPSTEIEMLIQQARQAVKRAKEAGGNQVFLTFL